MMLVVQRTQDDSWYDNEDVFVADESRRKQLVEVFGYFWHYLFNVSLNKLLMLVILANQQLTHSLTDPLTR